MEIVEIFTSNRQEESIKKRERKMKNEENQTKTINVILLLLFYIEQFIFVTKHIRKKNLIYNVTLVLQFFRVAVYWKCSNKTPTLIQICTGLIDTALRLKKLDNRQGISRRF